jgi:chromosome segregation ATPase
MNIDWKTELTRPVTLVLAALALVGWIIAISQFSAKSSLRASADSQIGALTATRQQLTSELDQQRQASGTLADLQRRTEEATTAANAAGRDRDAAAAQLAETKKAGEDATASLAAAQGQLSAATAQLDKQRAAADEAERGLSQSREAVATLNSDAARRTGLM